MPNSTERLIGINNPNPSPYHGPNKKPARYAGMCIRLNIFPKSLFCPVRSGNNHPNARNSAAKHNLLVRKGFDLYVDVYAPITTLLLGGKVEVPTLKGTTTIDVAPLTQSNTKYTLKGKGIKYLKGMGSGDIFVTLKGEMPKDLDKASIKLIKELQENINEKAYPKTNKYKEKLDK